MRLEDGLGTIIDTESKPPTIEDTILSGQAKLKTLKENLRALSAPTRDMQIKRRRQELQNEIDTLTAEIKHAIKRYEKQFEHAPMRAVPVSKEEASQASE